MTDLKPPKIKKNKKFDPDKKVTISDYNRNIKRVKAGSPIISTEDTGDFNTHLYHKVLKICTPAMEEAIALKYLAENNLKVIKA